VDLPGVKIAIADTPQRSSSTITTVSGYVVVLATALPQLGVTLTSVYLGQIASDTGTMHLALAPARDPQLKQGMLPGSQPGQTHARACILDHAAELQQLLTDLTHDPVTIDIHPDALQRATGAWSARD